MFLLYLWCAVTCDGKSLCLSHTTFTFTFFFLICPIAKRFFCFFVPTLFTFCSIEKVHGSVCCAVACDGKSLCLSRASDGKNPPRDGASSSPINNFYFWQKAFRVECGGSCRAVWSQVPPNPRQERNLTRYNLRYNPSQIHLTRYNPHTYLPRCWRKIILNTE